MFLLDTVEFVTLVCWRLVATQPWILSWVFPQSYWLLLPR